MSEKTLSIIKPDATSRNLIGEIISRFEKNGLKVVAAKMVQLSREQAGGFYAEHEGCLLYTSPSPRDGLLSRMPSSA